MISKEISSKTVLCDTMNKALCNDLMGDCDKFYKLTLYHILNAGQWKERNWNATVSETAFLKSSMLLRNKRYRKQEEGGSVSL